MSNRSNFSWNFKPQFAAKYASSLRDYLHRRGERELRTAYELGRQALSENVGLLEIALLHHYVLAEMSADLCGQIEARETLTMSGQFLVEVLSAYEMRQRAYRDAASTLRQMNELLEQETKRIAHSVHDEAGQLLVAAHLAIADVMRESSGPGREKLTQINSLLEQVGNNLRQLSHELRPTVLDDLGLVPAVRNLAASLSTRGKVPIRVEASLRRRLPSPTEVSLYRAIQEALANVTKHARARNVRIHIGMQGQKVLCTVKDDGVGFDPAVVLSKNGKKGLGLTGIQERLNGMGGTLQVRSRLGQGSTLRFIVPLEV